MAVTVAIKKDAQRGIYYEVDLSANGDAFQAHFIPDTPYRINWLGGDVSWHKTASVAATFTNAGPDAMARPTGTTTGWVAHPDTANTEAAETLPITGIRFKASAATQKVLLYTATPLLAAGVGNVTGV